LLELLLTLLRIHQHPVVLLLLLLLLLLMRPGGIWHQPPIICDTDRPLQLQ
jgi:hypothetical protein